ncbi:MAG: YbaK/EbsC family protein [Chloroflexi bacterium]|nr:YbaK/EbsC family protein [Chloroflexota bacterium]
MSVETVKKYFAKLGVRQQVMEFETSSATVELAAEALQTKPERIAKTLSFKKGDGCFLVVTAGDTKIDNQKFKAEFGMKATMLSPEEAFTLTGYKIGGICPFAVPADVSVYLDISLQRFETVFPACGSSNSAIELTCDELFRYGNAVKWVDVCKGWE